VSALAIELGLLHGEDPETTHGLDARHWVNIYTELLAFHEHLLDRLSANLQPLAGRLNGSRQAESRELQAVQDRIDHLRSRLEFWHARSLALSGVDFETRTGRLRHQGLEVRLTRREGQILQLLLRMPGHHLTAEALASTAWPDRRLSVEQVRTYIVRLRRKLEEVRLPCELENVPRRGYALIFD